MVQYSTRSRRQAAAVGCALAVACLFCLLAPSEAISREGFYAATAQKAATTQKAAKTHETHSQPTWWDRVEQAHGQLLAASTPVSDLTVDTKFRTDARNIIALILAMICAALANSAGIGGGPFYVPLLNIVVGFDLRLCTPLSHTLMASSAVGSTVYALYQQSPVDPNRPMVNFDIALTFIPILLFGNSLGVLLGGLIPEWLQTTLLTGVLLFVVTKTGKKGIATFKKEQAERRAAKALASSGGIDEPLLDEKLDLEFEKPKPSLLSRFASEVSEFWRRLPVKQLAQMVALWLAFVGLQLGKSLSHICSNNYWGYWAGQIVLCAGVTAIILMVQARRLKTNPDAVDSALRAILEGNPDHSRDKSSTFKRLGTVVSMMMLAGLIAGLLGVGGALVFNPYLLELGVHPQVTAATSVVMILFSSGSIVLSFVFQHLLNGSYAAIFVPFCFASSFFGAQLVAWIVNKTRRTSIVIAILTFMLLLGALATGILGGIKDAANIRTGVSPVGFTDLCI